MKCKFNYLQGKLRICHYFSKNTFLYLSEKLDIKHLHINFLKTFKIFFFQIMFFFMNGMHLKDATYDICYSFMDKKIDILFKLQV